MNTKYIENLIAAKESLKIWFANVEQLHYGNAMFLNANTDEPEKTEFAQWYYGEGQTFSSFETFKVLEPFYLEMYQHHQKYYELLNEPVKKSFFTNEKEKRQKALEDVFNEIKQSSRKLIKSVEIFEDKLKTSPLFVTQPPIDHLDFEPELNDVKILQNDKKELEIEQYQQEPFQQNNHIISELKAEEEQKTITKDENIILNTQKPTENNAQELNNNIEQKIQEEIAKLKKQLEKEFEVKLQQQKINSETQSETLTENKSKSLHTPVIDIEEEIRRILS